MSTNKPKQKVSGIGGFFFRAKDPAASAKWYHEHLGVDPVPTVEGAKCWRQEEGDTAFSPFPADTDYFGRPEQAWMINFRVTDLDAMVEQLKAAGIAVEANPDHTYGRFAKLQDPDGNPIELWQPT
ncbi:MAG TPA: VOC family protein [Opitutaceae bacterium]|jgi:predicted enzyme related to lactoylglutathione lyase|nr:VOC family protein [Opitutaceae bacterium]